MIKHIILILLISCQSFAGLPPTTLKGQLDTGKPVTFDFQVPSSQATRLSSTTALIETGNDNRLANPGFEASSVISGWTNFTGIQSADTTNYVQGKKSILVTFSNTTGFFFSQQPAQALRVESMEASAWVKTSVSGLKICLKTTNLADPTNCVTIANDNVWRKYSAFDVSNGVYAPSIQFQTTGTVASGTVNIDDAYLGPNSGSGPTSPDSDLISAGTITIGATTTAPTKGTTTNDVIKIGRKGDMARIRGEYKQSGAGTAGSGDYLFSLPNSLQFDPIKVSYYTAVGGAGTVWPTQIGLGSAALGDNTNNGVGVVIPYDATRFRIGVVNTNGTAAGKGIASSAWYPISAASASITFDFEAPVLGWSSQNAGVRINNTNYDWTTWTPAVTGLGTVSLSGCLQKREGPDLLLKCNITAGTPTAVTATLTLPNGLTTDANKMPTGGIYSLVGDAVNNVSAASSRKTNSVIAIANSNVLAFGIKETATAASALSPTTGDAVAGVGSIVSITARVSITGWTENQNAPMLIGGVTSSSLGTERMERVSFGGSSEPSACSGTPCTMWRNTPAITSVSRAGAGAYSINFAAGTFSSPPTCICMQASAANSMYCQRTSTPTSTAFTITTIVNGNPGDQWAEVLCMGPR